MNELLSKLNDAQRSSVEATDGPVMVIAGAGSGKTRVLTFKVAYLLKQGVDPFSILALTFTNKAAKEMKDRVENLVGTDAKSVWMGTFHSIFARLLRFDGHHLGYQDNFTIYDTDDAKGVLKTVISNLELDPKVYVVNQVMSRISAAKSQLISADEYAQHPEVIEHDAASGKREIFMIYKAYQETLFRSSAMDFDDIIFNFHLLITRFPEVLAKYQRRFRYILIDEFQDTNKAQYSIIKKLSEPENNLCVVGDDAQSIYAFRGANIENILGFKSDYPNYKLFKLEQNYRSTSHIVEASNSVIKKNRSQIDKNVWTDNGDGELIKVIQTTTDGEEASKVASAIFEKKMNEKLRNDAFAILYRTNAQSRTFEEALRRLNIPYIIYGGLSFYQRKEIKDLLAYFRLTINHNDQEAFNRIINYPARGIGKTTIDKIQNYAYEKGLQIWSVISDYEVLKSLRISSSTIFKIEQFVVMIENFGHKLKNVSAHKLANEIASQSGLLRTVSEDRTPEGVARMNNLEELINAIGDFSERKNAMVAIDNLGVLDSGEIITLDMFMQDVALLTDADTKVDDDTDKVQLMTIHAAKGLEFSNVFVVGMEENLFPSAQSIFSREDLEEERRLLYVACTRAQKSLTLSYADNRYKWGQLQMTEPSRFLKDFDIRHLDIGNRQSNRFGRMSTPTLNGFKEQPVPRTMFRSVENKVTESKPKPNEENVSMEAISDVNVFKVGDRVFHEKFLRGVIISVDGVGPNRKAEVNFDNVGKKTLLLRFAKLSLIK